MDAQETMTVMLSTGHGREPVAVEVPRRVGTVKLGDMLGEGAGGVVFAGYDEALHRKVAVKLLHRRRGDTGEPPLIELAKGVGSAARIRHPNILTIHTVETINRMPVIVMEYVDGISLRELLLRSGALDLSLAMYVMRSVVSAVATLHDANVIHRDLKPANVLFDRDGAARVCDFGLACEFDVAAFKGHAANIGGSPLYMAPEMFDGHVSPQSDVYALGVMLFEVLTGAPPFSAQTLSEIKACHRVWQPPLWQLERRGLPEDLCETVGRALHKRRFLRYKTAGHLLRALEDVAVPVGRDETLRMRIAELVSVRPGDAGAPETRAQTELIEFGSPRWFAPGPRHC
jgi:serine/threonine protein kinase